MKSGGNIRRFQPGERVIAEGEKAGELYILLSGELTVWRGRTELGNVAGYGAVVGELAALTRRPRSATVVAATECELLEISLGNRKVLEKNKDVLKKIQETIQVRYEIARNKARMYLEASALVRRASVQKAIVSAEKARHPNAPNDLLTVRRARRQVDEMIELYGDDMIEPELLRKIADQNGALERYVAILEENPWLDERLPREFRELEDRWTLAENFSGLKRLEETADVTAGMIDLLGEYESIPGVVTEMDVLKMEKIVPLPTRIDVLISQYHKVHSEGLSDRERRYKERQVREMIEEERVNAGKDVVLLHGIARELHFESEYEKELKRTLALSDTTSTFVDISVI